MVKAIRWVLDFSWYADDPSDSDMVEKSAKFELTTDKMLPVEVLLESETPRFWGEDLSGCGSRVGLLCSKETKLSKVFAQDADSFYRGKYLRSDCKEYWKGWKNAHLALAARTEYSWCEGWVKSPVYSHLVVEDDIPADWIAFLQRFVSLPVLYFPARER